MYATGMIPAALKCDNKGIPSFIAALIDLL